MHARDTTVVTGDEAIAAALSAGLGRALGEERAARWSTRRGAYEPTLVTVGSAAPVAAALTSARPATAATKIVDLWCAEGAGPVAAAAVLDTVLAAAGARGDAAVKWELAPGLDLPEPAVARGFVPLRRPWSAKGTERFGGAVAWLRPMSHDEIGYYAQTTMFTCGSVAALMAQETRGLTGFTGGEDDRNREVAFWRRASNFPACEPVGLAVALREEIGASGTPVEVALDADGPVLIEDYQGFERDFRAQLQEESARRAQSLGVPRSRERPTMDQIGARIAAGEVALLLVDEFPMHGAHGPHWILAHAIAGDVVLVEDPWVEADAGETWVDVHDLPIRLAQLERMVAWGPEGYRGVVFLRRSFPL